MIRTVSASVVALALGLTTTALSAGDVYQWKDANGVTHYSQTPPTKGTYKSRSIYHRKRAPAGDDAAAVAAKPVETAQCVTARNNVELIESGTPLQIDSNGDGTPDRDLGEKERADQLQMAKLVLRTSCAAAAAAPAPAKTKR